MSQKSRKAKPKSYEALRAAWYAKLSNAGFKDIEKDERRLKKPAKEINTIYASKIIPSTLEYYSMAGKFFYDFKFKSALDKKIWKMHAEGLSIREIEARIPKKRNAIHQIVKRLAKQMKEIFLVGYKN